MHHAIYLVVLALLLGALLVLLFLTPAWIRERSRKPAIRMRQHAWFPALLLALVFCPRAHACGDERWPVKVLRDQDVGKIALGSTSLATIEDLIALPGHSKKELLAMAEHRYPEELRVYRINGVLLGFKKETDGDFHIVVADPFDQKETMIVEIPDPACGDVDETGLRAQFESRFGKVTAAYKELKKPVAITVRGVGFFDFIHGQTGVAKNGFELHPVLSMSWPTPLIKEQ